VLITLSGFEIYFCMFDFNAKFIIFIVKNIHVNELLCRIQKVRVTKSKDELEQMHVQILDREAVIADQRVEIDTIRAQLNKSGREKAQVDVEVSALKT